MFRRTVDDVRVVTEPDDIRVVTEPDAPAAVPAAEVVVTGRNVDIPDHYRSYVSQKLARAERFDRSVYRFDVELDHERNRRQAKICQHVEITARGRGPVVRGEARADSFYAAFEAAVDKIEARLRRGKDRRKVHYGDKRPTSLAEATAVAPDAIAPAAGTDPFGPPAQAADSDGSPGHDADHLASAAEGGVAGPEAREPGRVVRVKDHPARPMTVDDALYEMELVGHDFFLFHDCVTDRPSVVYRRHAYDYGLLRLAEPAG